MTGLRSIEIIFPVEVEFPPGFERALAALIDMICEDYQTKHPDRVMWTAGFGAKPKWREPMEPTFDDSVYHIEVCEREKYDEKPVHEWREFTALSSWIDVAMDEGYDIFRQGVVNNFIAVINGNRRLPIPVGQWLDGRGVLKIKIKETMNGSSSSRVQ